MTVRESYINKCENIILWSEERPDFNVDFVKSVLEQLEFSTKSPSAKQAEAIDNIIEKFKIDINEDDF